MPAKIRDMRKMLVGKLRANEEQGTKHMKYNVVEGETLLGTTRLSRSYDEIDNSLLSAISKQLNVNSGQMARLLDCTWSREDYVQHCLDDTAI